MEFNKCARCGNFYLSVGNVCPKCQAKDNFELSAFKSYIEENGINETVETISGQTGITVKNINRFLSYEGFDSFSDKLGNINSNKILKSNKIDL